MEDKRFNPEKASKLMRVDRKEVLPPDKLIAYLDIRPSDWIADLGAGNGYFAIPMAKKAKAIYAVDIEPKMLSMLRENADQEQLKNIQYIESDLDKIQLDDDSVEKVMISLVLHEVTNIDRTVHEIRRILKPGGKMVIIEWEGVQTKSGPPQRHRIPSNEITDILERNGFATEVIPFHPYYVVKAKLNG